MNKVCTAAHTRFDLIFLGMRHCTFVFEKKNEYLVFRKEDIDHNLNTNMCIYTLGSKINDERNIILT